jgi:uncharacterized protein
MKLALVTGASSGLGKALCQALSTQNIPLILVARNEHALNNLALELPTPAEIHRADLSEPTERKGLIHLIEKRQPDLVINNAGFGLYGDALAHPLSDLDEMIEVNIQALMEITLATARTLSQSGKKGTILNVSSAAAFFYYPTFSVYAATKAFVNQFSRAMDVELKSQGIRVLTVCPGQIDTEFRKRASSGFPQERDRRTMSPEKAAALIIKQIEQGKSFNIIDWRYKCLIALTRLLPNCLLEKILKHSLKKRHQNNKMAGSKAL